MRIDDSNWNFVTGDKDSIYKIEIHTLSTFSSKDSTTSFSHSGQFIIVDKQGRVRSGYTNFVCSECGDISKKSKMQCPTISKNILMKEILLELTMALKIYKKDPLRM